MISRIKALFLVFSTVALFSACTGKGIPDPFQSGPMTYTVTTGGAQGIATTVTTNNTFAEYDRGKDSLTIRGTWTDGVLTRTVTITSHRIAPGVPINFAGPNASGLPGISPAGLSYQPSTAGTPNASYHSSATPPGFYGKLIFTKVDLTAGLVSGTFYGNVLSFDNHGSEIITNGSFNDVVVK